MTFDVLTSDVLSACRYGGSSVDQLEAFVGVIAMLRRVLIRLLCNRSAGDGRVSLTGVSR